MISASTSSLAGDTVMMEVMGEGPELVKSNDETKEIPTFTLPVGAESIPVESISEYTGYGYSVDSGLNYKPVQDPEAGPMKLFTTTSEGENEHELMFGVNLPEDAEAGDYSNEFLITVIANLEPCQAGKICYYGNGDDGKGEMEDQDASSNTKVTLQSSNFSRPGYGFAGWNTEMDGSGVTFGPSAAITTVDLSEEGLQLYAQWIPSAGELQGWQGCAGLDNGSVTALTDTRDGNTYAVAKYEDGQCWMMENLRLDLSDEELEISSINTNHPAHGFMDAVQEHPAPTNSFCSNAGSTCIDTIRYNVNNMDRNLPANFDLNNNGSSWYSYGGYYNWYTATAGNGTFSLSLKGAVADGDICPAGWRLPTGYGSGGDYAKLDIAMGGTGQNRDDLAASERFRAYPVNFIYSGEWKDSVSYNRGISGGFNASNAFSSDRSINFWLRPAAVSVNSNTTVKNRGQTVRCIINNGYSVVGNVRYDANGGEGTMPIEENVNFETAVAADNGFTKVRSEFTGWNTRANGSGVPVAVGGSLTTAASHEEINDGETLTLYAMWKTVYSASYDGNGATDGVMAITHNDLQSTVKLVAPNYLRSGYGFAGWSTDADAASKLIAGESVSIYGPNETVTVNSAFLANADENNNISLYATWLPADTTRTMQSFTSMECASMSTGEMLALTDVRNSQVYTVAKLADGHCWMTENLRLDPATTTFTAENTNSPTEDFITAVQSSSSTNTMCGDDNTTCVDKPQYNLNNLNGSLTPSPTTNNTKSSWYSYGGMYNWFTASAGNGGFEMESGSVTGDICPYGWRLPVGGTNGEYAAFYAAISGGVRNNEKLLLAYPNNFVNSGDFNRTVPGGRGTFGRFWSSTAASAANAFRLGFNVGTVTPANSYNKWDAFAVRCIVK